MKLIPALLFLCGCASNLTIEEIEAREWRRAIDNENWSMCDKAHRQSNVATYHHNHMHGKRDHIQHWMIRTDLVHNSCRLVLGDHWADY